MESTAAPAPSLSRLLAVLVCHWLPSSYIALPFLSQNQDQYQTTTKVSQHLALSSLCCSLFSTNINILRKLFSCYLHPHPLFIPKLSLWRLTVLSGDRYIPKACAVIPPSRTLFSVRLAGPNTLSRCHRNFKVSFWYAVPQCIRACLQTAVCFPPQHMPMRLQRNAPCWLPSCH